jgi:hypothetical protein
VAAPKARILGSIKPAIIPTEADFLDAIYGFGRIAAK